LIELEENYKQYLKDYKFIDLFAGIGGFHLALNSFGAECNFASEWDKHAQNVYYQNHKLQPHGDITLINENDIPKHDILCGGFPCQAFSISGKQQGFNDARGTLFFDILRIAQHHKPKFLLLENVKNFEKHDKGNTLQVVYNTLKEEGYNVFHKVLNGSDFGVPQSRKRVYITAFREDLKVENFSFPKGNNKNTRLFDILEDNNDIDLSSYSINREDIVMNEDFHNKTYENSEIYYPKPIRIGTISKGGQGERIYHPNGHAITLSAYGGGVAGKTGCYHINGINRRLTEREICRVSGFPDTFIVDKSKSQAYKQFGNTVIVNVLQSIIKKVIDDKIL
jgi:DNA (cytosine-5)-methyltransferase 1